MPSQWADQPYSLVSTTAFSKDVRICTITPYAHDTTILTLHQLSHAAYYVATQMSLAHNGIIRGLNSIYIQATNIPPSDIATVGDFLTYCQCWSESMHHHHDAEENVFFPDMAKITGIKDIMERNIDQHRAFSPGFDAFYEYAKTCQPKDYDGQRVRRLIEDFAEPLTQHLHDEIDTLRKLDIYDSEQVRQAYRRLEKVLMDADNVSCVS